MFEGRREALANLLGLAHGYVNGTLGFVGFAPEHLMDALCFEVARLGVTDPRRCEKTVELNDTSFERWSL